MGWGGAGGSKNRWIITVCQYYRDVRDMANHKPLDRVEAALYLGPETPADPCLLVIFGGSGDLTRRLLVPALYNLACDGLLSERFGITHTTFQLEVVGSEAATDAA